MDTAANQRQKRILETALAAAADGFGLRGKVFAAAPQAENDWADARLRLTLGTWQQDYLALVKTGLRPATLGQILHRLVAAGDRALLVADYVAPPLAEALKAQDVQFLDTAGNAHLRHPELLVWVKGERLKTPFNQPREVGRAFAPTGLKVILALLCYPDLVDRPYREIAEIANVAHGTVGWVMPALEPLGFVGTLAGRRRLFNVAELLKRWTEAYLRVLRPKLVLGRYHGDTVAWWETLQPRQYDYALGGEPAAGRITNYLRPGTVTLYGDRVEPKFLIDQKLRPQAGGEVELLRRFWTFKTDEPFAPLPVIYADLLATGDARCLEAARLIEEKFLAGLEPQG